MTNTHTTFTLSQLFVTRHEQVIEYRHGIGYTYATDTQISAIKRQQCPSDRPEVAAVVYINPLQTGSKPTKSYLIIARAHFT